jgi:DNA-binding PadR family transcriptional regulator
MSAADLTDEDMQFLARVDEGAVFFTRQTYRLWGTGQRDVTPQIQRLRALGLVRLTRHTQGQRLPPTRGVEPTDRGLEILQRTAA